jgi:E3 ubiquitin-protein ligase MUL1
MTKRQSYVCKSENRGVRCHFYHGFFLFILFFFTFLFPFILQVLRGLQEREEMLVVGTSIMGIGEILLEDGRLKLRPPADNSGPYFLTKMTKNQLVKQLRSQGQTVKIFSFILGAVAAGLLSFLAWRVFRKYQDQRKRAREFEEIRRATLRRRAEMREREAGVTREGESGRQRYEEQNCVVCLTNPREVVTLDCGHIAMCSDCAQLLPEPHRCPVCREYIERFLPVYHP